MCGACGVQPSDWAVPLVSGPHRRTAIAHFVAAVCRGVVVKAAPQGWTVATLTGSWRVTSNLDQLLESVSTRLTCTSWENLEAALGPHESRNGTAEDPRYADYRPRAAAHPPVAAKTVMTVPANGSLHLRLVAFGLGIRAFDRHRAVALDALERAAPFRLLAVDGKIVGSAPADLPALNVIGT